MKSAKNATAKIYGASAVKRFRTTKAEMEERAAFLIDYAKQHGPVTVRGLYYQAGVARIPGIDKTEADRRVTPRAPRNRGRREPVELRDDGGPA